MLLKSPSIAIFCHVYYECGWSLLSEYFKNVAYLKPIVLVNLCMDVVNKEKVLISIKNTFPEAIVINAPNIGKDIGGKLALLELYLSLPQKSDYLLFLHDKKSPHLADGESWNQRLLKIIEPEYIPKIFTLFEKDANVGLIGTKECISNEYDEKSKNFKTTNNTLLKAYIQELNINIKDYSFLAGTMFWVRAKLFEDFFRQHPPLMLRARLEKGNVMDDEKGTHTHCMERIFSWIVTQQRYKIKGI